MENEEKQPEETNNLGSGPAPAEVWTNDTSSIAERKTVPGTSKGLEGLSDILRNYKNTIEKEGATPSELNRMKKDLESLLPEAGDLLNSVNKALEKVDQNGISNDEKIKVDENNNVETAEGNSSQYAYNEPTLNEPDRRFNANDYSLGGQQKEPEARPTYTYNEPTLNAPDRRFNVNDYSLGGMAPVAPPNIPKGKDTVRPSNVNITVTNQAYFKKQSDGR